MRALAAVACVAAILALAPDTARADDAGSAAAMRVRFGELGDKLRYNQFRRPLNLLSQELPDSVSGEIHAFVAQPFAVTGPALGKAAAWCEILLLHLNTKACESSATAGATALKLRIGKKFDQPADDAYRVDFAYRVVASRADYLQVTLVADKGPIGTHDYRIVLEAAPADDGRTMIRLAYSYAFGAAGGLAMQVYLGTTGRDKVGFSLTARDPGGTPHLVGGMRGVVERNTMRYFLAIEAFLGALATAPASARLEKRLNDWFAAVEGYPRQLREMGREEYLDMKRKEYLRQAPG